MDSFDGLVKPTDLFAEKCVWIHKIEIVMLIELINKHAFWLHALLNKKLNLNQKWAKISVFFSVQVHGHPEIYGVREPQVKNGWLRVRNYVDIQELLKVWQRAHLTEFFPSDNVNSPKNKLWDSSSIFVTQFCMSMSLYWLLNTSKIGKWRGTDRH
jgi:hypothetical protein